MPFKKKNVSYPQRKFNNGARKEKLLFRSHSCTTFPRVRTIANEEAANYSNEKFDKTNQTQTTINVVFAV